VRRLLALGALAVVAACGGNSEPESAPTEPQPAPEPTTSTEAEPTTQGTTTAETTTEQAEPPPPPPGVPRFVAGYRGWFQLNDAPIPPRESDPHNGTKNVFASKRRGADAQFPNGTIVVKEAMRPGADFVGLIATMRKRAGADPAHNNWVFVEYTREAPDARFQEIGSGSVCWSCHMGAADLDYVFTR
jgi:Cytochrome P460